MVSNHLESSSSNPFRNNRAQNYCFRAKRANVSAIISTFKMTRLVKSNQTMLFINTDISSFPFICIRTFNIQDLISYLHTEITFLKYPFSVSTYKSKLPAYGNHLSQVSIFRQYLRKQDLFP